MLFDVADGLRGKQIVDGTLDPMELVGDCAYAETIAGEAGNFLSIHNQSHFLFACLRLDFGNLWQPD